MINYHDYQKSAPWIPPEAPNSLRSLFYEYATLVSLNKGEKIFQHNPINSNSLIYLVNGLLGNCKSTNNINKELISTLLLPNRVYSFSCCFKKMCNDDTLVALRESQILVLAYGRLQEYLTNKKDNQLKQSINNYFLHCLESEHQGIFIIATEEIQIRLAKLFRSLIHATAAEDKGDYYEVPIKLRNEEIRKLIYTTKKTINTILPGWKKEGLYLQTGRVTVISKLII